MTLLVKRALVAAAVAVAVLAANLAHADPEGDAQGHFKRGVKLYNLGHFQEAIPEFEKASKCAWFNYQREKIVARRPGKKKARAAGRKKARQPRPTRRVVTSAPTLLRPSSMKHRNDLPADLLRVHAEVRQHAHGDPLGLPHQPQKDAFGVYIVVRVAAPPPRTPLGSSSSVG